jgi:hypothetical protein
MPTIARIQATNPLVTAPVSNNIATQIVAGYNNTPSWDPLAFAYTDTTANDVYLFTLPQPPQLMEKVQPGGTAKAQTTAFGSTGVYQNLYTTTLEFDRFQSINPGISQMNELGKQLLSAQREDVLRREFASILAANPTLNYHDKVAFFSASHPIDPFRPWVKTPGGSATWSNSRTSTACTLTNIYSGINLMRALYWPNLRPVRATSFTVYIGPGIDFIKIAHALFGPSLGFNYALNGTADVGANTNPLIAVGMAFGINVKLVQLLEYTSTSTDWYIGNDMIRPWAYVESVPMTTIEMSGETDFSVYFRDRTETKVFTRFGVCLTHPLALMKNAA